MHMRFATLFVSDEDQAIDFYVNKLGFNLIGDNPTPFGTRFVMFAPPEGGAKLVVTKPVPGMQGAGQVGGFSNISWGASNVQETYERLKEKGVEFVEPPKKTHWGGVEARFADPFGNVFMLQEGGI